MGGSSCLVSVPSRRRFGVFDRWPLVRSDMWELTGTPVEQRPVARKYFRSRPPFKLNFVLSQELGRSDVSSSKPQRLAPVLSPKFYSRYGSQLVEDADLQAFLKDIDEAYKAGPKEKYSQDVLESHKYGWYAESLVTSDKSDARLHFPIRTSDMVKLEMEIGHCKF